MPLYEYECAACGHRLEIIQKFSDGPPDTCPKCGKGPLQRQQSSPAIQFKGTGWYVTDYAGKGKSSDEKSEKSGDKSGGDSKPVAAKSESSGSSSESSGSDSKKSGGESKKSEAPASTPAPSKD